MNIFTEIVNLLNPQAELELYLIIDWNTVGY